MPAAVKMLVNLFVYYVMGDQIAAVLNGAGRFGAVSSYRPQAAWGGDTSAFHQTRTPNAGMIKNTFGGN